MDELSKKKKTRGFLKGNITKYINKLETETLDSCDIKILHENLNYLTDMLNQIKEIDKEIQDSINIETEFDKEIQSAIEYSQKLTVWISKISAEIKIRQNMPRIDQQQVITNDHNNFESSTIGSNSLRNDCSKNIKLPKLSIEKYYGDPCQWIEFFNQFENCINKNDDLTKIDKFSYLKSLLGGAAFNVVNGFAINEDNYEKALKLLKERFGREELVINAHMSKLLNLYPVKSSSNIFGLRKLYDTVEVQIRSLDSLNVTPSMYGHLLHSILIRLLPEDLALNYNRIRLSNLQGNEFNISEMLNFLKLEIESRESCFPITQNNKNEKDKLASSVRRTSARNDPETQNTYKLMTYRNPLHRNSNKYLSKSQTVAPEFVASVSTQDICLFCNGNHNPSKCESLTIPEKKEIIKKQARCLLCLQKFHKIKFCKKKENCEHCGYRHNEALCYQLGNKSSSNVINAETEIISAISQCNDASKDQLRVIKNNFLLQTCSVFAKQPQTDNYINLRLLLDCGSMRSFVTLEVSEKLKLPIIRKETLTVYAFGSKQATQREYNIVKLKLENRKEPSLNIEIEALVTEEISATNLQTPNFDIIKKYTKLRGLQLADEYDLKSNKIQILIGVDYYYEIVSGRIKRLNDKLVASETLFGWCLIGKNYSTNELLSMEVLVEEERDINKKIEQFWQLENLGVESETETMDKIEIEVMKSFNSTIKYENKRYIVKLPWKQDMKQNLSDNRCIAKQRFLRLKNRLQNNISLYNEYSFILNEYINENIIEHVNDDSASVNDNPVFYLPHRGVIREDKVTSRLRIVYDASSHAPGEVSLNQCLEAGPNLNPDVFKLLIRFRKFPVGFIGDIKQAFLQILISDEDRDVTRFFWSDYNSNQLKTFRFTRVLFGVNSSPFLLAATIKHHLRKYQHSNPEAYKLLNECLYVDDVIGGHEDADKAFRVSLECRNIFLEAGMVLRKFRTSSQELRDRWEETGMSMEELSEPVIETDPLKVLGTSWDTMADSIYYDSRQLELFLERRKNTKRFLLQVVGRIFDPIGILGPYVVRIKCLIQDVWCLGLDWDDTLPEELSKIWNHWCDEIKYLREIKIPRYFLAGTFPYEVHSIQLHSFADASKRAYGTVIYLRAVFKDGRITSSFLTSKSRVSPLKTLSIPRLELMSALLSVRLCNKISEALEMQLTRRFWTDSSISYFWIKTEPERLKVFVRNRVREIQRHSSPSEWSHCPGSDNPADCISRGLSAEELKDSDFWWSGPLWLRQDESCWPKLLDPLKLEDVEGENIDVKSIVTEDKTKNELISRYSSFTQLIRISAWCLRFFENCKLQPLNRKRDSNLSASELQRATKSLVKSIQYSEFSQEIKCLKRNQPLPKNSKLLSLNVFLDEDKLLRVGGRIRLSELPSRQKHQLLLPKIHPFTDLLIEYYHKRSFHSGTQTTLSIIRQLYWIPAGQARVRRILNKCIICFRTKPRTIKQIMGDLPKARIMPSRPFETTGVDFAGPIITRPNLKRSKIKIKSYICIFICFSTKATHLEIVSELTTEAFVACLKRFIARRSRPATIWSDNGSNFKGTNMYLNTLFQLCKKDPVQRLAAEENIKWNFTPPASPHFGGLWEGNIKSMKKLLLKMTGSSLLTFEELNTFIVQIEAILNSRPICPLSSDPADLQPLTPGHFLVGAPPLFLPENDTALGSLSLTSRWTMIQRMMKEFWKSWSKEYLLSLQTRSKWTQPRQNLDVGQLALLKEDHLPPFQWKMCRILQLHPGHDGLVRVADVRTLHGTYRRAITKIIPLPLAEDIGQPSNGGRDE